MLPSYVLILDDDLNFALELEVAMATSNLSFEIVNTASKFIQQLNERTPEVAVVHLYIDGNLVGFDCAEAALNYGIPVVFVTAYADERLVRQAIQTNCYAFLTKPVNHTTLLATLELAKKSQRFSTYTDETAWMNSSSESIVFIRNNNRLDRIDLRKVTHVNSEGNDCTIYLDNNRKFIAKSSLTQLQRNYFTDNMIRIHRNYMVHLFKIESVNLSEKWVLVNGIQLPIGRRYQNDLINRLRTIK